jgi:hypothetical protein
MDSINKPPYFFVRGSCFFGANFKAKLIEIPTKLTPLRREDTLTSITLKLL